MSQKYLLIALGVLTIVGLLYIIFNATQNNEISPISPSTSTFQPKTAKMMPPVEDKPVTGQLIVKFKPQYTAAEINRDLRQYRAAIKSTIEGINQTVVSVPKGQEESIMQKLKSDPYVQQVQRDYTTHAFLTPNDPQFALQYAFNNTGQAILGHSGKAKADINAETAWNTTEGNGVKVAILDTGINLNQPDLAGKVILQKSFVTGVSSVEDGNGHGTHVAGILAADTNNNVGIAGTCPGCQLLIGKVLDNSGSGTTSEATAGITWAADNGAKVISMSLGTTELDTASMYNQAVSYALSKGAIVVAAAGNDGITQLNYPAAATGVVSVAATTNTDAKASYSNFGNWVEIAAPGDNILSTGPTHSFQLEPFGYNTSSPYYYLSGTSMATPIVSGVAALIASTSFGTTPQAIINRLYSTADKITGTGTDWVHGRVDAAAAVGHPASTPTPTPTPKGSLITPTLFCVGGTGTPPCATLPPTAPTNAPSGVGSGSNGGSNPSSAPSSSVSQGVRGNPYPSVSNSPSVSPIAIGSPIAVLPCPNQNQTSSLSTNSGATTISSHGRHWKIHHHSGGFLSQFFKFLLQLLLQLLQLIGINPCGTTGTPTVTPVPGQPSNTPSQTISTVPPVSGAPTQGGTQPTAKPTSATAPTSVPAPTTPVTSSSCTNPSHVLPMNPGDPQDGFTLDKYYITNDTWNASGFNITQTMYICNFNNWYVVAGNMSEAGGVKTYPNVHEDFNNVPISSFKTVTSTFASASPPQNDIYDAAYDIWVNNQAIEVMIWNDSWNKGSRLTAGGTPQATVTLGGRSYDVYHNGGYIAFVAKTTFDSGTVDILQIFNWIISQGWMASNSTLGQIDYGIEFISTNNQNATFKVTNFSVTTN